MRRREFTKSTAVSVTLGPLSQIETKPDDDDEEDDKNEEILLRMSKERFEKLQQRGEVYQVEQGIWRFIPEEHRE